MKYDDVTANGRMSYLKTSSAKVRLMRNLKGGSRITPQSCSRDINSKFREFKMMEGRHIENDYICMYQPQIIQCR